MPDSIPQFVASVAAEVIAKQLAQSTLGVICDALPAIELDTFVSELSRRLKKPARLAILGAKPGSKFVDTKQLSITSSETKANLWRNDETAVAGQKLVVLVVGTVAKLRSLQSSLDPVNETRFRVAIRDRALSWNALAARKTVWEVITSDLGRFPTARLCDFAAAVSEVAARRNTHDILEYEIANLFRLGLLRQPKLFEVEGVVATRKLIAANAELVGRLRSATREVRARVGRVAEDDLDGLGEQASSVLAYMQSPRIIRLEKVDHDKALRLVAPRNVQPKPPHPDDIVPPPTPPKKEKRLGDEVAVEDILNTGGENLGQLEEEFKPQNDDRSEEAFEFDERKIIPISRPGQSQIAALVEKFFTAEIFGGYIEATSSSDYVAALHASSAEEIGSVRLFRPANPQDSEAFETLLTKIVRRGLPTDCQDVLETWTKYGEIRSQLLPQIASLVDHPLLALARSHSLLELADSLVRVYGVLADKIDLVRKAIEEYSPEAAKSLSSRFISLDVVFIQLQSDAFVAIAGPTHPFHLWRWIEIARLLYSDREELASLDEGIVVALASNPPVSSPHLLLTSQIEGVAKDVVFLAVGSVAALPLYSDPQSRTAARIQGKGLAEVLQKLLLSAPYAVKGCEVVAIDPPSVVDLLAMLDEFTGGKSDGQRLPLHLRVFRSRPVPAVLDEEEAGMENLLTDVREAGGSVEVDGKSLTQAEIIKRVADRPAHFVAVFEPGDAQAFRVGLEGSPTLSPLVVPRSYRYDDIKDRFDVVITGNETPFGGYYNLFCQLQNMPTRNTIGRRSGASSWLPFLSKLGQHTLWFSIIDQGLEPTLLIENAVRLDRRLSGGRDVYTYTCHVERVKRTVRGLVQSAGLVPDDHVVEREVGLMRRLGGDTVPVAMSTSHNGEFFKAQARGILGVLAVGAWHEQEDSSSLLVSLDSEAARTWILGYTPEDRRRGDLLCLRQSAGGIHLEVIEVKVRDDVQSVVQISQAKAGKRIEGYAVEQIDNVVSVLKRILAASNLSRVDRARREILRDQLYMAIATRDMESTDRGRADRLLQEFFRNGPSSITGRLFVVHLETSRKRDFPSAPTYVGSSKAGNPVEVYTLVESDLPDGNDDGSSAQPIEPQHPPDTPTPTVVSPPQEHPDRKRSLTKAVAATPAPPAEGRSSASDGLKVFLGHDPAGNEVSWNSAKNPNFGFLITGDPGMGKSQTIRVFLQALREQGFPVIIFDFKNDYTSDDFAKPLGLKVYDIVRKGLPFNPLSLIPDENGDALPIRQCHELAAIISRVEGFGEQQQNQFVEAQKRAYERHGIDPRKRVQVASITAEPVFDEVLEEMASAKGNPAQTAMFRLQKFSDLGLFPSERSEVSFEDLIQTGVVLTLNDSANDNLMRIIAEILIMKSHAFFKRGEQPRQLRRALVFDEAWRVAKSERLVELAREGRAFGVGLLIGSQFPDDLPANLIGSLRTHKFSCITKVLRCGRQLPACFVVLHRAHRLKESSKHWGFYLSSKAILSAKNTNHGFALILYRTHNDPSKCQTFFE